MWEISILKKFAIRVYSRIKDHNENLVTKFIQFSPFLLSSLLTGILAFLYSKLFFYSEKLSSSIFEIFLFMIDIV